LTLSPGVVRRHHLSRLLLAVPAWRAHHDGQVRVIVDHAVYGADGLTGLVRQ
jgi:hypothetical protein